jgi:RimJ/RimL family protein N-acetyltransferase
MGVVALHPDLPLETERLLLRGFELSDEDALLDFHRREDVARYLYNEPMSREDVRETLVRRIGATGLDADSHALRLAVVLRDGGLLIGDVSLRLTSGDHAQGEIGFVFNPDHHGHGYATEAGRALLGLGFEAVGMHRIVGRTEARNVASARVLERLGMRREAHFVENEFVKGEWQSELVYAMLAAEWNARV